MAEPRLLHLLPTRCLGALFWIILMQCGQAHPLLENKADLEILPGRIILRLDATVREIQIAQSMSPDADAALTAIMLRLAAEQHAAYLNSHVHVRTPDATAPLSGKLLALQFPDDVLHKLAIGGAEGAIISFTFEYSLPAKIQEVTLSADMLKEFHFAPAIPWQVSYAAQGKSLGEASTKLRNFGAGATLAVAVSEATTPAVSTPSKVSLWECFYLGLRHILTGWDHLLFIAALSLAASRWADVVKLIAAFTAGHHLSLLLGILRVVRLPGQFVEPLISLSVVVVAAANLARPRISIPANRLALIASLGLLHGLGFHHGALEAISNLGATHLIFALLSFSAAAALSQIAVAVPPFLVMTAACTKGGARTPSLPQRWASALIAVAGCYYLAIAVIECLLPL